MEVDWNPLRYRACFMLPKRTTSVESWHVHIPFAFFCAEILKPRVFVELGVHRGDSFCAFCQAVVTLGLSTQCYGVDTWQGDEHAGFYGDEVLTELRTYHDPLYGRFSSLIRSTFDEARARFPDQGIDLLHVDGCHTYEAVRHDVEGWLPKLSQRGVLLLHDIGVRERGFGVWRLWEELRPRYPSLEFANGYGLGVLAVGPQVPREFLALLRGDSQTLETVSTLFVALGERVLLAGRQARAGFVSAEETNGRTAAVGRLFRRIVQRIFGSTSASSFP